MCPQKEKMLLHNFEFNSHKYMRVQLNWSLIVDWAYASIFAVAVQFQNKDQFLDSSAKIHGACILDFFKNSQNELGWPCLMFLAILAKIR